MSKGEDKYHDIVGIGKVIVVIGWLLVVAGRTQLGIAIVVAGLTLQT